MTECFVSGEQNRTTNFLMAASVTPHRRGETAVKILLFVVGIVLVIVLGGLGYMGAFAAVKVEEREMGPYLFVYVQESTTDFGKIGELTESLGKRLEEAGFEQRKPAQVFYPTGRGIQNQIGFMVDRPVGRQILGFDTFFRPIAVQRYMVARFPYRNPLSFVLGYFRVDPAFKAHREAKGYPETNATVILEGDSIHYLQRVDQD